MMMINQQDFTSDFYFRQAWKDSRLSFKNRPGISELYVGAEVADRIWVPDTFFANEKSAYFHTATTPNTFLRIGHSGEVFRSMRSVHNKHSWWFFFPLFASSLYLLFFSCLIYSFVSSPCLLILSTED